MPQTVLADIGSVYSTNNHLYADPGSGATVQQNNVAFGLLKVASGTRVLPDNGLPMYVQSTSSTVTVNNASATTVVTLGANDVALCYPISSTAWVATILGSGSADLENLYAKATSTFGHVDVPLHSFREVDADGDVANAAGNGGILASDTGPIMEGAGTTNAQRINWATGNVDRIASSVTLPRDMDDASDCQIGVIIASGDVNGFDATVVTNWNGGADVTDTMVDAPSGTVHRTEVSVAASDIPTDPMSVSISFTPPSHATDAYHLYGCYIRYKKKVTED